MPATNQCSNQLQYDLREARLLIATRLTRSSRKRCSGTTRTSARRDCSLHQYATLQLHGELTICVDQYVLWEVLPIQQLSTRYIWGSSPVEHARGACSHIVIPPQYTLHTFLAKYLHLLLSADLKSQTTRHAYQRPSSGPILHRTSSLQLCNLVIDHPSFDIQLSIAV